ncbi:Deuterolysin metalloprotease family-domain-containing protein [Aspergillus heterothallicus]
MFAFFVYLLAVFTLASGKPVLISRLDQDASLPSFDVTLQSLRNTTVQAQVTNLGTESVRLVRRGGILDPVATKKVTVHGGEAQADFTGAYVGYHLSHLTEDAFVQVSPNQTVTSVFDIDTFYTLSAGQEYTAVSNGVLEYTTLTNTTKFHTFVYESNNITFTTPANVKRLRARTTLDCSNDDYNTKVQSAISRAAKMATAGAADARAGASDNFQKFFFSSDQDVLDEVASRLEAIAEEATSTGVMTYYCAPRSQDDCSGNVAAMTYPSENIIVNCDLYYSTEAASNYCGYLDQGGIALHEYTHATGIYSPGTDDVVYGYDSVQELDTNSALNNADSYAYYAAAVYLQCAADDSTMEGTPLDVDTGDSSTSTTGSGSGSGSETTTATSNPEPTYNPTSTPSSGDWPWGQIGGDSGSGTYPTDTPATPTSGPETGSSTGGYGDGGYGGFPPAGPSSGPGGFGGFGQGPWGSGPGSGTGWSNEAVESSTGAAGAGPTATWATSVAVVATETPVGDTGSVGAGSDFGSGAGSGTSIDVGQLLTWLESLFNRQSGIEVGQAAFFSLLTRLNVPVLDRSTNQSAGQDHLFVGMGASFGVTRALFILPKVRSATINTIMGGPGKLPEALKSCRYVTKRIVPSSSMAANEAQTLAAITNEKSDCLVRLLAVAWDEVLTTNGRYWPRVLLEAADYGNLSDFMANCPDASDWNVKSELLCHVLTGLKSLHEHGVAHCDLKLENVLVFRTGITDDTNPCLLYQAKVCDFGFSVILSDYEEKAIFAERLGTEPWTSPELTFGTPLNIAYLPQADIYSYGLLSARVFMNGGNPFETLSIEETRKLKAEHREGSLGLHRYLAEAIFARVAYSKKQSVLIQNLLVTALAHQPDACWHLDLVGLQLILLRMTRSTQTNSDDETESQNQNVDAHIQAAEHSADELTSDNTKAGPYSSSDGIPNYPVCGSSGTMCTLPEALKWADTDDVYGPFGKQKTRDIEPIQRLTAGLLPPDAAERLQIFYDVPDFEEMEKFSLVTLSPPVATEIFQHLVEQADNPTGEAESAEAAFQLSIAYLEGLTCRTEQDLRQLLRIADLAGLDLAAEDASGNTPLLSTFIGWDFSNGLVTRTFLSLGANPHVQSKKHWRPLDAAVKILNLGLAKEIVDSYSTYEPISQQKGLLDESKANALGTFSQMSDFYRWRINGSQQCSILRQMVNLLIDEGSVAGLKKKDFAKYSNPLIAACFMRHEDLASAILDPPQCPPLNDNDGKNKMTALHWAIERGMEDIAMRLLKCDADPLLTATEGMNAFHQAARSSPVLLGNVLAKMDNGEIPRPQGMCTKEILSIANVRKETIFAIAVTEGSSEHLELAEKLRTQYELDHDEFTFDIGGPQATLMAYLIKNATLTNIFTMEQIEHVLNIDPQPRFVADSANSTLLHYAVSNWQHAEISSNPVGFAILRLHLRKFTERRYLDMVNDRGYSAIHFAALYSNIHALRIIASSKLIKSLTRTFPSTMVDRPSTVLAISRIWSI